MILKPFHYHGDMYCVMLVKSKAFKYGERVFNARLFRKRGVNGTYKVYIPESLFSPIGIRTGDMFMIRYEDHEKELEDAVDRVIAHLQKMIYQRELYKPRR